MSIAPATLERLPPSNVSAEEAVLGACLIDPAAISRVREHLVAADFFRDAHRLMYEAMIRLADKGWPADIVSLADELERDETLQSSGGIGYINSLATVVPTAIHCEFYAQIVRRTAVKRRMITTGSRIAGIGYDDALEADDAMALAEHVFLDLQAGARGRSSGIFTVTDFEQEVEALYESGWKGGVKTLWHTLDPHYTIVRGELTVLTGIPSHGKSTLLDALIVGLARTEDWHFFVSSPEVPIRQHIALLAEKYADTPFGDGPTPRMTRAELADALAWVDKHFTWVMPYEGHRNIESILATMPTNLVEKGCNGIVLDPWNAFEHDHEPGMSESKYISRELTRILTFAAKNDVHVWLVAHPTKMQKDPKTGQYPVPRAYDIADSAHFANKAHNIISIWRDQKANNGVVEVHVQKVKDKHNGVPGMVPLHWTKATGNFDDMSVPDKPESEKQQEWT